jgi:hypothetical protein
VPLWLSIVDGLIPRSQERILSFWMNGEIIGVPGINLSEGASILHFVKQLTWLILARGV